MKISIEFSNMRDMLTSLPKFAALIGGEGTPEERFAAALADDPKSVVLKVTPTDGKPITDEEKENIKTAVAKGLEQTRTEAQDDAVTATETAQDAPKKEKTEKSKAKKEKPSNEAVAKTDAGAPTEIEVRKVFNDLIKAGKRDKLKEILDSFGASNFSGLGPDNYAEAIKKARAELGEV